MLANGPERPTGDRSETTGLSGDAAGGTGVEFDDTAGGYVATADWTRTSPTVAVVELVAAVTGRRPADLSPLGDVLDPDHLNGLVDPAGPTPNREFVRVEFGYEGFEVTVEDDGRLVARPVEDADR